MYKSLDIEPFVYTGPHLAGSTFDFLEEKLVKVESMQQKHPPQIHDHINIETKQATLDKQQKHKLKVHRPGADEVITKLNDNVTCDRCRKMLSSKASLAKHLRYHDNIRPYKCRFCWKSFVETQCLYRHINVHHGKEEPIKCPFYLECGKTFWLDEKLDKHLKTHKRKNKEMCHKDKVQKLSPDELTPKTTDKASDEDLVCHLCRKTFSTKGNLTRHIRSHDNEVKSNHCEKTLRGQESLAGHLRIHDDELACYRCGKKLSSKPSLARHMRYHDNVRPYNCRFCGKTFVEIAHVYSHIKLRHAEKEPIRCPFYLECGKTFWLDEMLEKHLKQGHIQPSQPTEEATVKNVDKPYVSNLGENNLCEILECKKELNDEDEKSHLLQDYCGACFKIERKIVGETIIYPKTTTLVHYNSDIKHTMIGQFPIENRDFECTSSPDTKSEANVIRIVPSDNSSLVETGCNSHEDVTDPVIHNILPIHEDQNPVKNECHDWSNMDEVPLKIEDIE